MFAFSAYFHIKSVNDLLFKIRAAVLSVLWLGPDLKKKSVSSSHHPSYHMTLVFL